MEESRVGVESKSSLNKPHICPTCTYMLVHTMHIYTHTQMYTYMLLESWWEHYNFSAHLFHGV